MSSLDGQLDWTSRLDARGMRRLDGNLDARQDEQT